MTAGGAGAVATGAFSAATAERNVEIGFSDNDATAALAFESTSRYTSVGGTDNTLSIDFDNLNVNSDFTFEDVFVIRNNGTNTIRLSSIGSGDGSASWNAEDLNDNESSPANVLIADEKNQWQGSTPSQTNVESDGQWTFQNPDPSDFTPQAEATRAVDLFAGSDTAPNLEAGDFISIGFRFAGTTGIGDWDENDIPGVLQVGFEEATGSPQ